MRVPPRRSGIVERTSSKESRDSPRLKRSFDGGRGRHGSAWSGATRCMRPASLKLKKCTESSKAMRATSV